MSTTLWKLDLDKPHQRYHNAKGKRLRGVTTVIKENIAAPQLNGWYASMERAGIIERINEWIGGDSEQELQDVLATLPLRSNGKMLPFAEIKRDKAATVGTIAHAMVEAFHHGTMLDPDGLPADLYLQANAPFARYLDFWRDGEFRLVASEVQMVSERWQVGGTADVIALGPDGEFELHDTKTTKASSLWPYRETFAQVAAYAAMYEENYGHHIARIRVVRIGNAADDFGQVRLLTDAERAAGERLFLAAKEMDEATRELAL